jgi:hypothetical protein
MTGLDASPTHLPVYRAVILIAGLSHMVTVLYAIPQLAISSATRISDVIMFNSYLSIP